MRLRSTAAVKVTVPALELTVAFEAGEEMRTEISAKFRPAGVAAELAAAGFVRRAGWTDSGGRFLLTLAEAADERTAAAAFAEGMRHELASWGAR